MLFKLCFSQILIAIIIYIRGMARDGEGWSGSSTTLNQHYSAFPLQY